MEVIRKCKKEVKKVQVGDQIVLGRYTATAVAQDASGTTFCFDQVYGESPVKTPYDWKKMKALYKSKAMKDVSPFMVPFTPVENAEGIDPAETPLLFFRSPTAEEIFSKQHLRSVAPTTLEGCNKRWEIMKTGSYHVAFDIDGVPHSYWTESTPKAESPILKQQGSNVIVTHEGFISYTDLDKGDSYIFWRPVFKLKV